MAHFFLAMARNDKFFIHTIFNVKGDGLHGKLCLNDFSLFLVKFYNNEKFSHGQNFFAMARFFPWPGCFPMGKACFPWEKWFLPWESELQVLFIGIYNKDRESIISFY